MSEVRHDCEKSAKEVRHMSCAYCKSKVNSRLIETNRHLAEAFHEMALELADARAELRRLRRTARIDRERAEMVSQLEDENLELKKRLGCFDDVTPPVSWYAAMREENERLNRELAEALDRTGGR